MICDWNNQALSAIRNESTSPPLAARNLAMLHIAIHDAVNSVEPTHHGFLTNITVVGPASVEAAAATAAHRTLRILFPSEAASFDSALADGLQAIPDGNAKSNGIILGRAVADGVLSSRSADGSATSVPYIPSDEPGAWRRTAPFFRPPDSPQWGYVMPFAMVNGFDLRPMGPPPLTSARYAADVNEVKSLGAANSTTRSAEQTLIARFWSDFSYTVTPPGHWNQIAQNVSTNHALSLEQNARLFALLNIAMADAGIAVWDAKYTFNSWRPITAIAQADTDDNPETIADPDWTPLLNTPPFPEYVSGHSAFSAAAAAVLAQFFGSDHVAFTVGSDSVTGVTRSFTSFSAAAEEIGMSRIYGGIHFLSADLDGLALGHAIGEYVEGSFIRPLSPPPAVVTAREANGGVQVVIDARVGAPCVIEASTNLVDWLAVATNVAPFAVHEPAVDGRRFFRVHLLR